MAQRQTQCRSYRVDMLTGGHRSTGLKDASGTNMCRSGSEC